MLVPLHTCRTHSLVDRRMCSSCTCVLYSRPVSGMVQSQTMLGLWSKFRERCAKGQRKTMELVARSAPWVQDGTVTASASEKRECQRLLSLHVAARLPVQVTAWLLGSATAANNNGSRAHAATKRLGDGVKIRETYVFSRRIAFSGSSIFDNPEAPD